MIRITKTLAGTGLSVDQLRQFDSARAVATLQDAGIPVVAVGIRHTDEGVVADLYFADDATPATAALAAAWAALQPQPSQREADVAKVRQAYRLIRDGGSLTNAQRDEMLMRLSRLLGPVVLDGDEA